MGTVSFRSAPILYFYLQARDAKHETEGLLTSLSPRFFYALSRAYFTKGIFLFTRISLTAFKQAYFLMSDYTRTDIKHS